MRISVKFLLGKSLKELDEFLTGTFTLICDDGDVEVHTKDVLLSSFVWRLNTQHNNGIVNKNHIISTVLGNNGRIAGSTILNLLSRVIREIDAKTRGTVSEDIRIERLYQMTETAFDIMNQIYNEMSLYVEPYASSLDILDVIEVLEHPDIDEAYQTVQPNQDSIDNMYRIIKRVLHDPSKNMTHNPLSKLSRSGLISEKQIEQCLGPRGYCTDTDSMIFDQPIMRSYADGIRLFRDSVIESRSASKSLSMAKADLQDAEYFSRRLQLLVQSVENLHRGDCGSKDYMVWHVRPKKEIDGVVYHPGDLKNLVGVTYLSDDGLLKTITDRCTHLIGKSIKIRTVFKCHHPDPKGVCSTCYGALSDAIAPNSNLGHINAVWVTQKSTQSVLSVKHLDGSSVIERILLNHIAAKYLGVGEDGNSYTLLPHLKNSKPKIIVPANMVMNVTDVDEVEDVRALAPRHVSEIDGIMLSYQVKTRTDLEEHTVGLPVVVRSRLASFTHEMLEHIKKHRWEIAPNGDYVFDMSEWDFSQAFLELPLRHFNMSDHSRDIARLIESRKEKSMERERVITPDQHMVEVFDLVNAKLNVNFAPLSVIVYGSMIRSSSKLDYALPKAHTSAALGVSSSTMLYRSLAVVMAFQEHHTAITSPYSFLVKNRPEHIFDAILCPREVQHYGSRV